MSTEQLRTQLVALQIVQKEYIDDNQRLSDALAAAQASLEIEHEARLAVVDELAAAQAAIRDLIAHSGIADAHDEDKEPEDLIAESRARAVGTDALDAAIAEVYDHARKEADRDWQGVSDKIIAAAKKPLVDALVKARETIHALHGDEAWEIYDKHSPEMKQINAALAQVK